MKRFAVLALIASLPTTAHANFHLWDVAEVYSNADGSVQYIELLTTENGQHVLSGHVLTVTSDGTTRNFTIPANLPDMTAGHRFIVATPGFASLSGAITPDYVLPCGPFFDPDADSITIDFAGADVLTFTGAQLPTDGTNALVDADPAGVPDLGSAASSPTNYDGDVGALALIGCLADGSCDPCDDGMFCNGVEACSGMACATTPSCTGLMCDELGDRCFECDDETDCDDTNACTDDSCDGSGACVNTPNTDACDDGLFCTETDVCADGACEGSESPCTGTELCLEGIDACGACASDGDCDDGAFCNGAETCAAGECGAGTSPCDASEACDEADDACDPVCGNGELQGDEACDDGDLDDGDGCTASCQIEAGFSCDILSEPSVCTPLPDGGVDAGSDEDGGTADLDAGSSADPDAGTPSDPDAGTTPDPDAGPTPMDGGVTADAGPEDTEGGCGCRVVGRDEAPMTILILAPIALAWSRRRR